MRQTLVTVFLCCAPTALAQSSAAMQRSIDAQLAHIDSVAAATRAAHAPWKSMDTLSDRYNKTLAPTHSSYLHGVARYAFTWTLDPDSEGDYLAHVMSGTCSTRPEIKAHVIKALEGNAIEPSRRLAYARAIRATEPALYLKYVNDVVARYPTELVAMRALSELADDATTMDEKRAYLERIRTQFVQYAAHDTVVLTIDRRNQPESLYNRYMRDLFGLYLQAQDAQASDLARQMAEASPTDGAWQTTWYLERRSAKNPPPFITQVIDQARTQITLGDAKEPYREDKDAVYATIVSLVGQHPVEPFASAIYTYGATLGKSREQVDTDVWSYQQSTGKPFREFSLTTYDGKQVDLADLRGKIVLLSFWFPTCQGCVEEFGNFEKILEKYRGQHAPFVLLAVNILPEQDTLVRPLFDRMHLDFTALKAPDADWESKNYGVWGGPHNYLIDSNGRTIYQHFYAFNPDNMATVERQIDWLLTHMSQAQ